MNNDQYQRLSAVLSLYERQDVLLASRLMIVSLALDGQLVTPTANTRLDYLERLTREARGGECLSGW